MIRRRASFLALAFAIIALGLGVHFRGAALRPAVRDAVGDALWAMMIASLAGALAPRARLSARVASAYAICAGVEVSQLYHSPGLDALRATTVGQLVLGSGFDPRDLVMYGVGVAFVALVESIPRRLPCVESSR